MKRIKNIEYIGRSTLEINLDFRITGEVTYEFKVRRDGKITFLQSYVYSTKEEFENNIALIKKTIEESNIQSSDKLNLTIKELSNVLKENKMMSYQLNSLDAKDIFNK